MLIRKFDDMMMSFFFLRIFFFLLLRLRDRLSPSLTSSQQKSGWLPRDRWRTCRRSSWRMRSRGKSLTPGGEGSPNGLGFETTHWEKLCYISECLIRSNMFRPTTTMKSPWFLLKVWGAEEPLRGGGGGDCVFVRLQSKNSRRNIIMGEHWDPETSPPSRISITSDDLLWVPLPCI